ncbi:Planctomycete cytochrome C [Planctomycetes bacterium Poly30]|uniref:Planctomycete cytochrome C n=1 Tax=Saltatorellus ferox TaxID=2528018 RepID=A0A518EZP1_9BACT|nr:Planctomycete cytochrome C [Planctomycetes bacterium Poly30]
MTSARYTRHYLLSAALVCVAQEPDLATFQADIEPILSSTCLPCHGPEKERGGFRVDELDPDLVHGEDVDLWLDVLSVVSNGEMPPEGEGELAGADRGQLVEWLSIEVQNASMARKGAIEHSALRRMTRYEYEYALQDLFGLPYRFADDLPPDPTSEDGFQNSSELLHLSPSQLRAYFESGRSALLAATVRGERPAPVYWDIPMDVAAKGEWERQNSEVATVRGKHADDPQKLEEELAKLRKRFAGRPGGAHFESLVTGRVGRQSWNYNGAQFAWAPTAERPSDMGYTTGAVIDHVGVIPRGQGFMVELGEKLPEDGLLRVRVLASRAESAGEGRPDPSLQLHFGWQASNDSRAVVRISDSDLAIDALPGSPAVYEFLVPMHEVAPRNWVRKTAKMGELPSPSEYIKLVNSSLSGGAIHLHHVQVEAPVYEQWPPASHLCVFPESPHASDEPVYAREVLASFLTRAWRRAPSADELERKLALFERLRPESEDFQSAMIEVLATVLSSPNFLFVGIPPGASDALDSVSEASREAALATRLAMFLWCSTPDDELLALADRGELSDPAVLDEQVERMLADPRAERFPKHFVRQWLGMSLLDYLQIDRKVYPQFDTALKESMAQEPVAFFRELLRSDGSVLGFLHSDFTMADERLASHYGIGGVTGNDFRRVPVGDQRSRGGLLAQAGLLAMNSDGKDSHPLKRGVWLLERLLNDPPPPPPPAVPMIDLADPRIAQMTLKERIEDHRNDPACISCHAKIDPWGIAFENFDAAGSWRDEVQGKPIDANSVLFNGQELAGIEGLKRFLLDNRQDQFVAALVHKMSAFALGRPLSFGDRAALDAIAADVRAGGDGLATMVKAIATSELFVAM